jgi:hypothetical protein
MKTKYLFLILIVGLLIFNPNIHSLKILEPLTKDLTLSNTVDLGYFSAGEFFMISFFLENDEKYHTISVAQEQINDVIIEQTKKTPESIFTIIKLDENLKGNYSLKLLLISQEEIKEVILNLNITDDVIHSNLLNYNPKVRYEQKEELRINIINKSNTTKTIVIKSDLPVTWFDFKKQKLNSEKKVILQPNSITEQTYQYFPKEIGYRTINLQIHTILEMDEIINTDVINYNVEVEVIKDLNSIYGSKKHTFPLFNSNLIPIYFLNKIIKII